MNRLDVRGERAGDVAALAARPFDRRTLLKGALALGLIAPAAALLAGCNGSSAEDAAPAGSAGSAGSAAAVSDSAASSETAAGASGSVLVAYYSAQGHTAAVAEAIAAELGADTFVITPTDPYTDEDLNYGDDASRVSTEHLDENRHVELTQVAPDGFDGYDTVFVGYPIWWGEAAWVVDDFAAQNDFTGKTVIPFCTSASSPLGQSGELLAQMAGTGDWQEGMRFRSSAAEQDVTDWVRTLDM